MSVWADFASPASFGGVEFDCLTTRDSIARVVVRRARPRVDGADLQDMGAEPRETTCRLIFWDRDPIEGEDVIQSSQPARDRFDSFLKVATSGKSLDFVHPVTGAYRAKVENLDFEAEAEEDVIFAECTFVEDRTFAPPVIGPGLSFEAGTAAVAVEADLFGQQLAAEGLDTDVADQAAVLADGWDSDPDLTVREVNLQLLSMADAIDQAIQDYEMATDVNRYPLYRSAQKLLWNVRQAAAAFRQTQPQLVTITATSNLPLRVLCAEYYGAEESDQRYREVQRLNDIDDPSLIRAGTKLRAPARSTGSPRRAA